MKVSRRDRLRQRERMLAEQLAAAQAEIVAEMQAIELRAAAREAARRAKAEQRREARAARGRAYAAAQTSKRQALRRMAVVVASAAAEHFGRPITSTSILEPGRTGHAVAARRVLIWIGREQLGMTYSGISLVLERTLESAYIMHQRPLTGTEATILHLTLLRLAELAGAEAAERRAA